MKMIMIAVYDAATQAFTQPMFVRSKGEAIRSFSDAVGDAKSLFCSHPEDYTLFHIADYDDSTGAVVPLQVTVKLITALECVSARQD